MSTQNVRLSKKEKKTKTTTKVQTKTFFLAIILELYTWHSSSDASLTNQLTTKRTQVLCVDGFCFFGVIDTSDKQWLTLIYESKE